MKLGLTRKVRGTPCPKCGKLLDAATPIGGDYEPNVGSVTVCAECGELLEFTHALDLMPISPQARDELIRENALWAAVQAVQEFVRARRSSQLKS